jgi:hypothetical protein
MTTDDAAFARAFVASARWQTAVTVREAPHQYSLDSWNDEAAFARFAALIKAHGYRERWDDGHTYRYLDVGEHRYWLSPRRVLRGLVRQPRPPRRDRQPPRPPAAPRRGRAMRAILFAAKSTIDARGSIPDQLVDCRALATHKGYEVAAGYKDEDAPPTTATEATAWRAARTARSSTRARSRPLSRTARRCSSSPTCARRPSTGSAGARVPRLAAGGRAGGEKRCRRLADVVVAPMRCTRASAGPRCHCA